MGTRKKARRPVRGLSRALERGRRTFLRYPMAGDRREYLELLRISEDFHRPWKPAPAPDSDPYADEVFQTEGNGERCEVRGVDSRQTDVRLARGSPHLLEVDTHAPVHTPRTPRT